MIDIAMDFFARRWLEIGSFFTTCAALFYAHLAYRVSSKGLDQAQAAQLTNLRIQAKAGLSDAEQSLVSLQLACASHQATTERDRLRRGLTLPSFKEDFAKAPSEKVGAKGRKLLHDLNAGFASVDQMGLQELEAMMRLAKVTSLKIRALSSELPAPS